MYQIWTQYHSNALIQMAVNIKTFASTAQEKCAPSQRIRCSTSHTPSHSPAHTCTSMNETKDFGKGIWKGICTSHLHDCCAAFKFFGFVDWHACVCGAAAGKCDLWNGVFFISAHIFLVPLKQTFCYWLQFEAAHWSGIVSKFGTFSCTGLCMVICWNFISFFFGLVYFGTAHWNS